MLNVAAAIWNRIAQQGTTSQFGARYMGLSQDALTEAMQELADKLESEGNDPEVVSAYLQLAPLVAEKDAISAYALENPIIRQAVPEVTSVKEAVLIASEEYFLSSSQQDQLTLLLESLLDGN